MSRRHIGEGSKDVKSASEKKLGPGGSNPVRNVASCLGDPVLRLSNLPADPWALTRRYGDTKGAMSAS